MAEVFISYAREDQGFARDIHAALQKVNRDTWIDWRSIPDSAKWRAEIFAAIEAADNFLFVISPDSVKSWMCGQEVSHAVANNKRLITILYHSVEHKELLPALAEIQWIDYPNLGFEQTFERLTTAIDTDLNWVRKHTQFLVRATEWESKNRDQGFLLHGMELKEAVQWLEQAAAIKDRKPTELQEQYIRASEEWEAGEIQRLTDLNEEKERQRREAKRRRQQQVEGLLDEARKQMVGRRFTAALDLLKEAQKLDPSAPQLRILLERLASEHQQEKQRRELDRLNHEVQEAIDRDDYKAASERAAEALGKFPNGAGLARLKELADAQIEIAAQKEFVRNQTAAAQELLDSGQTQRALDNVEKALQRVPGNGRLESLRALIQDRMLKERTEADKTTCLRQADEAISLGRYSAAIQILESAQVRFVDSKDLDELLRFAKARRRCL